MNDNIPFLSLEDVTIKQDGQTILSGINLEILPGQQLALTGRSGSGKSPLLNAIAGKQGISGGRIRHHYYERYKQEHPVSDPYFNYKRLIATVSSQHHFKNKYNLTEFYYQQRFNSADAEEAATVAGYLSGVNGYIPGEWNYERVVRELHLSALQDRSLIKLSNGQTRRLLFAEALLHQPRLLLLDAPFTGLDAETRPYFHDLIGRIAASGITVVMATSPDQLPPAVTHVARLGEGGLQGMWEKQEFAALAARNASHFQGRNAGADPDPETSGLLEQLLQDPMPRDFEQAVVMKNVDVHYGDTRVLHHIDWTVKRGERWALSGPNGAGKSTLLSLINADNPQAYANDIVLFDRKRGSGESIWDIKKKIGYISPEMHQYFKTADTCLQVVLSGLFDTLGLIRKCTPGQVARGEKWMDLLGVAAHKNERFVRASTGIQRLTLLARALIKNPPLLVLDEPCQGMDNQQVQRIRALIDAVCARAGTTLIYVTHYQEELPACIQQHLKLKNGRVSNQQEAETHHPSPD